MDLAILIPTIIGLLGTIGGLFGWSHKSLSTKIDKLEDQMQDFITRDESRQLIGDKLAPHKVEYFALSRRIDELAKVQKDAEHKLDTLLEICLKLSADKK